MPTRRTLLVGAAGAGLVFAAGRGFVRYAAVASTRPPGRFVFIIQRGAADGLSIVAPVGDPAFESQRGILAQPFANGKKLDSEFALHPSLKNVGALFDARQAMFVHAVSSPYHERSHFDGQNVLETGGAAPYALKDGWLHRLAALASEVRGNEIAMSNTVPLVLRGSTDVMTVAPEKVPAASEDLIAAMSGIYEGDRQLGPVWAQALQSRELLAGEDADEGTSVGQAAGKLLQASPGVAVIETSGWDTHTQQAGRVGRQLTHLDKLVGGLKDGLGEAWNSTMVLIATEFGRTVRMNGTGGTDHGTASLVTLLGGAVAGGKVIADWPGLSSAQLYENRDLRATGDMFGVIGTALAQHFGHDPDAVIARLFPGHGVRGLDATFVA